MPLLYVVPTPIGNLEDITLRAINVLKDAAFVMSEDTRTTGFLLHHLSIKKPLVPFHLHNEHKVLDELIERIKSVDNAVLVSDAGTPAISDPGYLLVRACIENGIQVSCLPGATAFVPALVNSGLPCDRFCFEGFLPQKKGRHTKLESLKNETRTMVFYESPFRLVKTLEQFAEYYGPGRRVCVSRELTKIYEENARGTIAEVLAHFKTKTVKGEIVIVLEGCKDE